ncbi:hypothetical protein [Metallibacterium sp.]|uniref:hypothetical protein n=1 Tax=Metallibacterium sp. TaxID=2940281 RepID=UPI00261F4189|nr:hypothetical protein [Metallibacterium sp.]
MSAHVRPARLDLGGGIKRSPRPEQNYDQISHDITRNTELSYTAQGVLIRLLSNADGVSMTADDLLREKKPSARSRRGTGRRAILAALAELRLQGYLQTFTTHGAGGMHLTTSTVYDQPQPAPEGWRATPTGVLHHYDSTACVLDEPSQVIEKTEVRLPAAGYVDVGKRTPLEKTREVPRDKSSSTRATRVPAPDAGAAAAEPAEKGNKKTKAFRIIAGVECWTPEDPATTAALISQHGVDAVASVVAALHALGIAPLPGRVAKELQRRASAALAAKAHVAAEERTAKLDAESRRRGDRDMQELMALQANQSKQERDA